VAGASKGLVALVSCGIDAYQSGLMARMRPILADRGLSLILYCCTPYSPGLPPSLVALLRTGQLCGIITTVVSLMR
jgi:hypothetical protein